MTLADLVELHAAATPDKAALRFGAGVLTYAALAGRVAAVARGLAGRGVTHGDRVAVLAHNHPGTLVLLLACSRLGAMLVPLNWRLAGPELAWILADATPALLFLDGSTPAPAGTAAPVLMLDTLPEDDAGTGRHPRAGHDQPVLLVYTSGTTGRPKGAVLTGQALLANAAMSRHMHGLTADDHVLTVLPLFHVGALNIQTTPALLTGATVTLHQRFEPGATLAAIAADRPTLTVLVPSTLLAVLEHPGWPGAELGSLRAIATGSSAVPRALTQPFVARGVPVLQVYGATETCPIAIYNTLGDGAAPESTGRPGPFCEAVAADDAGQPVTPGVAGEILLRGPQLFAGYWNDKAATADAMRGGWYHTGDIGTQGADGTWIVHDRRKNLIVSGGENIYPAEIERVLHDHPGVLEAAVVGAPDPRWQAVPVAHVVLRPGWACTEAEIITHVRSQLARFKTPRTVVFAPSLPRNAMGKVQHHLIPPC